MTALDRAQVDDDHGGWDALAGLTCTCPPGCTTGDRWGDGPRDCDPGCRPCRIRAGRPYVKRRKTKVAPEHRRTSVFERPVEVDS